MVHYNKNRLKFAAQQSNGITLLPSLWIEIGNFIMYGFSDIAQAVDRAFGRQIDPAAWFKEYFSFKLQFCGVIMIEYCPVFKMITRGTIAVVFELTGIHEGLYSDEGSR